MSQMEPIDPIVKEVFGELDTAQLENDHHIDFLLRRLKELKDNIDYNKEQIVLATDFWDLKTEKAQDQIASLESLIENYIMEDDRKTLKLQHGSVTKRVYEKVEYPTEEVLVHFCHQSDIPLKIVEKPIKKDIVKYVKETGNTPEVLAFVEATSVKVSTK